MVPESRPPHLSAEQASWSICSNTRVLASNSHPESPRVTGWGLNTIAQVPWYVRYARTVADTGLRTFKTKPFARFAGREGIVDAKLCEAVERAAKGLVDADLGGGVIKQRIARPGQGRSGGVRALVLFRRGERAFFVHGFAKSAREDLRRDELRRSGNWRTRCSRRTLAASTRCWRTGRSARWIAMAEGYRSEVLASVHETARGMTDAG